MKRFSCALLSLVVVASVHGNDLYRPQLNANDLKSYLRTEWFGVYLNEQKIGNFKTFIEMTQDGIVEGSEMQMKLAAQGKQTEVKLSKKTFYDSKAPFSLLRAEEETITPEVTQRTVLQVKGNKWILEKSAGTRKNSKEMPAKEFTLGDSMALEAFIRHNPVAGAMAETRSLDLDDGDLTIDKNKVITVQGEGTQRVFHVEVEFEKAQRPTQAEYSPDGKILKGTVGPFGIRHESEAQAKDFTYSEDLFKMGIAKVDRPLGSLAQVKMLTLEVKGSDGKPFSPGAHQRFEKGQLILGKNTGTRQKTTAEEETAAMRENVMFPINDPRIAEMAKNALGNTTDPTQKVALLLGFVSNTLKYEATANNPDVEKLLSTRKGDCKGYSRLFTILARHAGIPTREISGLVYMGDQQPGFGGHAWNEVALNGVWIPVDALAATYDPWISHIKLNNISDVMGKLSFKVVEIK